MAKKTSRKQPIDTQVVINPFKAYCWFFFNLVAIPVVISLCGYSAVAQPLQNRLMLATSLDGLAFTKANKIIYNFADVPDAVVTPSKTIHIYFQGNIDPVQDVIVVGISPDGMSSWTFQRITITGVEGWPVRPCDPDVVLKNGVFRLYFTGDPLNDHVPETYSAVSSDGIHFTLENGVRFSGTNLPALDPSLLWIDDTLHYFSGGGSPTENWHALSTDGLNFRRVQNFSVNGLMMSNGLKVTNGYRFYGFPNRPPPDQNIQSVFTTNGQVWNLDPGVRLSRDPSNPLEAMYVKDPAIVRRDSIYLMYYVTRKPEYSSAEESDSFVPLQPQLYQNYPNPFNPRTRIEFSVPHLCEVHLEIFDVMGRTVATLVDERKPVGQHAVTWDAATSPGGIYFYRLLTGNYSVTNKMLLLR